LTLKTAQSRKETENTPRKQKTKQTNKRIRE